MITNIVFDSKADEFGPGICGQILFGQEKSDWNNSIVCLLFTRNPKDGFLLPGFFSIGQSVCSREDVYDAEKGIYLAFSRAVSIVHNKQFRKRLWNDLRNRLETTGGELKETKPICKKKSNSNLIRENSWTGGKMCGRLSNTA